MRIGRFIPLRLIKPVVFYSTRRTPVKHYGKTICKVQIMFCSRHGCLCRICLDAVVARTQKAWTN
jgi:hypothetical protein